MAEQLEVMASDNPDVLIITSRCLAIDHDHQGFLACNTLFGDGLLLMFHSQSYLRLGVLKEIESLLIQLGE